MTIQRTFLVGALSCAIALGASAPGIAQSEGPAASRLYEKFDVLGVFECEVRTDLRLVAGTDRPLRCDYTPREGVDVLKRYSGYVRTVSELMSYQEGDYVCWNLLRLRDTEISDPEQATMEGAYSTAAPSVIEQYELKEHALVGGFQKVFVLESRCVAEDRVGRNLADDIVAFEVSK